jgi:hypothetical protein
MQIKCRGATAVCVFFLGQMLATQLMGQSATPLPTAAPAPSPLPQPPYAIITYPSGDPTTQPVSVVSLCADGTFALVGLQPDEIVNIVVQYPTDQALETVGLEALDGGIILPPSSINAADTITVTSPWGIIQVLAPNAPLLVPNPQVSSLVISVDGTLTFTFVAAHQPGRNKITLRTGGGMLALQFWVFDPNNPQNNPGCITPTTPDF